MPVVYEETQTRKLVNTHRHVDGPWFWTKYTAHPYSGCRSGCAFCYLRGGRYLGKRSPESFDTRIGVKVNAVERLRKELARLPVDVIAAGDWQKPAEDVYRLSRGMLEVVREQRFPLFVVERSPLLVRDLDLLADIDRQTWVGVALSISNLDSRLKHAFEPRSPGVRARLRAMQAIASEGILVGTSLMPILPLVGDRSAQLEDVVKATADHGGRFVLAGGLTMEGPQAELTLAAARRLDPQLPERWRAFYDAQGARAPAPGSDYRSRVGLRVRELCHRHGLADRMPRYVRPGPLGVNDSIAEKLFLRTYDLELEGASGSRIWAYRRAAWLIDELEHPVSELFSERGEAGLQELPGIGRALSALIARWLRSRPEPGVTTPGSS